MKHILERSRYLRNTRYEAVSVVPDLTQSQRRGEQRLRAEADRRNQELTNEDRERNLRWIVVGGRGEKRLIKGTEREDQNNDREGTGSRGGWEQVRGRGGSNRGPVRGINSGPARGSNSGPARGRMTESGSRLSVGNGEPRYSNNGTNIEEGTPMNSRQEEGEGMAGGGGNSGDETRGNQNGGGREGREGGPRREEQGFGNGNGNNYAMEIGGMATATTATTTTNTTTETTADTTGEAVDCETGQEEEAEEIRTTGTETEEIRKQLQLPRREVPAPLKEQRI